jgi:hypothetical protein
MLLAPCFSVLSFSELTNLKSLFEWIMDPDLLSLTNRTAFFFLFFFFSVCSQQSYHIYFFAGIFPKNWKERMRGIRIPDRVSRSEFLSLKPGPTALVRWWPRCLLQNSRLCKPVSSPPPKLTVWLMLLGPGLGASCREKPGKDARLPCLGVGWGFAELFLGVLPVLTGYPTGQLWKRHKAHVSRCQQPMDFMVTR